MKIDSFPADRSPDGNYKTMNLAGIFVRERGLFMKPENKGRLFLFLVPKRCHPPGELVQGASRRCIS